MDSSLLLAVAVGVVALVVGMVLGVAY